METSTDKKRVITSVVELQTAISKETGRSFKIGFDIKDYNMRVLTLDDRFKFEFKKSNLEPVVNEFCGPRAEEAEAKFINFFLEGGQCKITMDDGEYHFNAKLSYSDKWIIDKVLS